TVAHGGGVATALVNAGTYAFSYITPLIVNDIDSAGADQYPKNQQWNSATFKPPFDTTPAPVTPILVVAPGSVASTKFYIFAKDQRGYMLPKSPAPDALTFTAKVTAN